VHSEYDRLRFEPVEPARVRSRVSGA
jgi:hypothetical protein